MEFSLELALELELGLAQPFPGPVRDFQYHDLSRSLELRARLSAFGLVGSEDG